MSKLEFNPNKLPPTIVWATYIPERTTAPAFKMHKNRGHALNALCHVHNGILYRFEDEEWVEKWRVEDWKQLSNCEGCNKELRQMSWGGYSGADNKWINLKDEIPERKFLCWDCRRYYTKNGTLPNNN